jgi:hypothetical protein
VLFQSHHALPKDTKTTNELHLGPMEHAQAESNGTLEREAGTRPFPRAYSNVDPQFFDN